MPRIALTDLVVRAIKPTNRYVTYWDERLPAFGVRVGLHAKTFIVMRGRDRQRVAIGRYPDTSLAEAREKARRLLLERRVSTERYQDALALFIEHHLEKNNKPSTAAETERLLRKHFPFTGDLSDITRKDITRILDGLKPSAANHAFTALRTFLNWCLERQYVETHALVGAKLPHRVNTRDRVLSDDELAQVWYVAEQFPFPMSHIVRLLITTGQRLGEVTGLQWSWIDVAEKSITLPPAITKNSQQHIFPIGPMTLEIIGSVTPKGNLLFPALGAGYRYQSHSTAKRYFDTLCPIPHFTWHDLRRTFSTIHARIGTPVDIQEALLNHKSGSRSPIQRIYDRYDRMKPMRAAMARYDEHLTRILANARHVPITVS